MDEQPLVDVSTLDLETLQGDDNPQVSAALKRILADVTDSEGVLSAFQSFIGGDRQHGSTA